MLLESSKVGAVVDVNAIVRPEGMDLTAWLKMYPGMGFVVTARPENASAVLEVFERRGLLAQVIGRVTEERRLIMSQGEEEAVLFNLETECVTGIH
jgi:selenophosphate synthetase-related protein